MTSQHKCSPVAKHHFCFCQWGYCTKSVHSRRCCMHLFRLWPQWNSNAAPLLCLFSTAWLWFLMIILQCSTGFSSSLFFSVSEEGCCRNFSTAALRAFLLLSHWCGVIIQWKNLACREIPTSSDGILKSIIHLFLTLLLCFPSLSKHKELPHMVLTDVTSWNWCSNTLWCIHFDSFPAMSVSGKTGINKTYR